MLSEQADAWFYKPNLGDGQFGATETLEARPSLAATERRASATDRIAGDGNLDLVDLDGRGARLLRTNLRRRMGPRSAPSDRCPCRTGAIRTSALSTDR